MKDYHINVFYSEADEGYVADIPDLKCGSTIAHPPSNSSARSPLKPEFIFQGGAVVAGEVGGAAEE